MNIREKFKAIRKQRKLSLKALGKIAGSATSISDFENGKTNLSNDVLLQLLGYMIVEINEIFEWDNFHDPEYVKILKAMETAVQEQDCLKLMQLKKTLEQLSILEGQYIYHIISLVLDVTISEFQNNTVNPKNISELTDYFFSIEYWTNLDIGLIGNIVTYFTTDALILFTNSILENTPQILRNNLDRIRIDTVLNCLSVLISRREKEASKSLLLLLSQKSFPTYFAFQKLFLLELQAIYCYTWENKKEALVIHKKILTSISLLCSYEESQEWDDLFKKETSKTL